MGWCLFFLMRKRQNRLGGHLSGVTQAEWEKELEWAARTGGWAPWGLSEGHRSNGGPNQVGWRGCWGTVPRQ